MDFIKVSKDYQDELLSFKNEMLTENYPIIKGSNNLEKYNEIDEYISHLSDIENKNKKEEVFLVINDVNQVIGIVNLKYYCDDNILNNCGNIEYSVRPNFRNRGYGKKILNFALKEFSNFELDKVLVVCEKDNDYANKVIISQGGVFENEVYNDEIKVNINRYWIPVKIYLHEKLYLYQGFLGKGKGGYSYCFKYLGKLFTVKILHHEKCSYYQFGNKLEAELFDYNRLLETGIRMPIMEDYDQEREIIIKEYIPGWTIQKCIENDVDISLLIDQVKEMAKKVESHNLNIDYYPTNFIVNEGNIYYIDYECNIFDEKWSLENWGIKHWKKS